jgi:general secretion pathway protein H
MGLPAARTLTVISPAGSDSRGFSLFELVLVLLLLGVSMAIVLPNIEKGLQDREVRGAALGLAATARDLRSRALLGGVPQQLVLNLVENSYRAAPSVVIHLPAEVKFVSIDGGENLDQDQKRFYFFPNGSSMGGTIVLTDSAKSISYLIRLEALTGRVAVTHGDNS